jgi:tetratricopeptide (TPR) repeat protein
VSAAELRRALGLINAGRAAEAESALTALVARDERSPDAWYLLGFTLGARRRLPEARQALERSLAIRPAFPMAWHALGNVLVDSGEGAAAERAYRRAVELRADDVDSWYNLALLLQGMDRPDEAIAAYRKAIALRPELAAAHNNLANALKSKGRVAEALVHYAEAVRLAPELADALSNYGTVLREEGRVAEAVPHLERAAKLKPDSPPVLNNLGIAYFGVGRFADAEACYRKALAIAPDFDEARNNLGNALMSLGHVEQAEACYREVIRRRPDHADAYSNLALTLQERGRGGEAIAAYERALELEPDHADALNNAGFLLQEEGRRREAMALYRRSLEANPRFARAAYNLGLAHLFEFEFGTGWPLTELRYHTVPPVAIERSFAVPRFGAGDWGRCRRLAIWKEQGVGDQLLYATLVPEIEARGQAFTLEADARLVAAFARTHPHWKVVTPDESDAAFAECDRHIPVASLPGLLRLALDDFARRPERLLAADAARAAAMRAQLAPRGERLVGISWRSFQPRTRRLLERKKSAPLESFLAVSRMANVKLVDLQYGDTTSERAAFGAVGGRLARLDGLDLFNDLDGVLAAIAACDLVVTTSNVTAHLAGALGKETWLVYLGAQAPFFYWVPGSDGRSLWYPSVRIVTDAGWKRWEDSSRSIEAQIRERFG